MSKKTIFTVGLDSESDFKTISEAIKSVDKNSKVFIKSGVYNEVLYINKEIELIGDSTHIPVVQSGSGLVCSVNAKSMISNIHFTNTSAKDIDKSKNDEANADTHEGPHNLESILQIKADCICKDCEISNAVNSNIKAEGKGIKVQFDNCKIHGAKRNGMYFVDCDEASITKSVIFDNGNNGISIKDSNYKVEDCEIYEGTAETYGTSSGIFIGGDKEGTIINSKVHDVVGCGMTVCVNAKPNIKSCEIYNIEQNDKNFGVGIYLSENSNGNYIDCTIHDIEGVGIWIQDECTAIIDNCKISSCDDYSAENTADGIRIYDNSKVTIKNSSIHDVEGKNIYINDDSKPIIENCEFDDEYDEDDCLADKYLAMTSGDAN